MKMMLVSTYEDPIYNRMLTLVKENREQDKESYRFVRPFLGYWSLHFVEHQCITLIRKESYAK